MKHIVIALFILKVVFARPHNKDATITWYENFNDGLGNFRFAFQTSNGITQQQSGQRKSVDETDHVVVMQGLFSFIAPENSFHEVRYIADENGYRAQVSVAAPVLSLFGARSTDSQKDDISGVAHDEPGKEAKLDNEDAQPEMVFSPPRVNLTTVAVHNNTNVTDPEEFPDRIGTPAIITLMGGTPG